MEVFMPNTDKTVVIDMHKHGFETKEWDIANLTPHQFLQANLAIAGINNYHFVINCGSHDSTLWGKKVWDLYNKKPKLKEYLTIYPQSEFNVDIGQILTYQDEFVGDSKFVFKNIHMLVAAKKGMEEEFFKKTRVYSAWSNMYIKKNSKHYVFEGKIPKSKNDLEENYINIGEMMKAARNMLCYRYCIDPRDRIPFDIYENTLQIGLTYAQIRERFLDASFKYLVSKGLIPNTGLARQKLSGNITKRPFLEDGQLKHADIFKPFIEADLQKARSYKEYKKLLPHFIGDGFSRLQLADVPILFGKTAYTCVAHPKTIVIRKKTGLPVSAFDGVDISTLPEKKQLQIRKKLEIYKKTGKDYLFTVGDGTKVLFKRPSDDYILIEGDFSGIVKDEIVLKYLDQYTREFGFKIDGFEISPEMFSSDRPQNKRQKFAWDHFDLYAKYGKAVNCNSCLGDLHMNFQSDLALVNESMSYADNQRMYGSESSFVCTKCSWVDLLETGQFDKQSQQIEVKILKEILSKKAKKQREENLQKNL